MSNTYTPEQKAEAVARVLQGESLRDVAQSMGIVHHQSVSQWVKNAQTSALAIATPLEDSIREKIAVFLMEGMETLTDHAKLYRDPTWRDKQTPETLLAVDRSLGSNVRSILDRLIRRDGDGDPAED